MLSLFGPINQSESGSYKYIEAAKDIVSTIITGDINFSWLDGLTC